MNIFSNPTQPRILVAPLYWGLGHATRCIPIINALLKNGVEVWLAGDGKIAHLLKTEFPNLPFLTLPGYDIRYGKTKWSTAAALLRQVPRLLRIIQQENNWLQDTVNRYKLNAVISDNRYGLYHPHIYTVFITHQLQVKTPMRLTGLLLQKRLYSYINRFSACWVPDAAGTENLAGVLAHPKQMPAVPVIYIGALSRFMPAKPILPYYLLVLLSGPEPQRTLLEELLLQQIQLFQNPILIVRGLPAHTGVPSVPYHVTIVNHLPAAVLQKAIESAQFVISRCGYSTVMDMMTLQKKCIFIPTPMQTEQQYLAKHLMKTNAALCLSQQKFQLKNAVALAETFPYQFPKLEETGALQNAVSQLLQHLSS